MNFNSDFRYDLEFSEKEERKLAKDIFQRDISTIEVKVDRKTVGTGNIYIETSSRGKPSGIMTTQSDMVFYQLEGTGMGLYFYTEQLRKTVKRLLPTHFKVGGDNNTSEGVLVNVVDLIKALNETRQKDVLSSLFK
jgi:hypothetical protein